MGCLCFRGGKQDLSDLSAPLDPAVPKPKADNRPIASSRNGRQPQNPVPGSWVGPSGAIANGLPANNLPSSLIGHGLPHQEAPAPTRPSFVSSPGDPAAAAAEAPVPAGGSMLRLNTGSRPQPLVIPDSPQGPPAHPKAANWDITPNQHAQQVEEADVEDIEVDLEEVQELSPIPTASATPASRPTSLNGAPPYGRGRSGGFQHSPSNLGPGRSAALGPANSSRSTTVEDDGVEAFTVEAESPPPGSSPMALIYSQQQEQKAQNPFAAAPSDDCQPPRQQPGRSTLAQQQSKEPSFALREEKKRSQSPSNSSFADSDGNRKEWKENKVAETQEDEGSEPHSKGAVADIDGSPDSARRRHTVGAALAHSQSQQDTPSPRPQSGRKTAQGPHAPVRPSPLGHAARPLARQDSNLSDDSDLSLPGEYERYGGGSSEDEEVADRHYEEAITAAGGQVIPRSTSRGSLAASARTAIAANEGAGGIGAGGLAEPTLSPGTVSARKSGYENPIWREVLDEEDSAGLDGSPQSASHPQQERQKVQPHQQEGKAGFADAVEQQQRQRGPQSFDGSAISPQGERGVGSDFDCESSSDEDDQHATAGERKLSSALITVPTAQRDADASEAPGGEAIRWGRQTSGDPGHADVAERTPPQHDSIGSSAGPNGAAGSSYAASNSVQGPTSMATPVEATSTIPPASTTAAAVEAPNSVQSDARTVAEERLGSESRRSTPAPAGGDTAGSAAPKVAPGAKVMQLRSPSSSSKAMIPSAAKSATSITKPAAPSFKSRSGPSASAQSSISAAAVEKAATMAQRIPGAPSPTSASSVPHFMLPTRSAVAHRRPSDEGSTPISGIPVSPPSGGTVPSTARSAITSTTTAVTPTPATASISKAAAHGANAKLPSAAASAGTSRPPAVGSASTARGTLVRQSVNAVNTAASAATPLVAATAQNTAAGPGSGPKPAAGSVVNSTAKASPAVGVMSASSKALGTSASAGKPAARSAAVTPTAKAATSNVTPPPAKAGPGAGASTTAASVTRRPLDEAPQATGTDSLPAAAAPSDSAGTQAEYQAEGAAASNPAAAQAPSAVTGSGGGGALPFGEWRMVRLKKDMRCCAADGTVAQETHDGQMEVFKCEETLSPGTLAAVISHYIVPSEGFDGARQPKTWVFCPDPLCMESKPEGSQLPPWPAKIILAGGVKVTRAEYDHLKGLGLDVTLPGKAGTATAASG